MIIEIICIVLLCGIITVLAFISYELQVIYNALVAINSTNVKTHNLILKEIYK